MVAVASSGFAATVGKAAVAAPAAPSWDIFFTDWSLDVTFPVVVGVAAAYIVGLRRLHARGRSWPAARTIPFLSGLALILIATESGLAAYDRVLFSLHVVQHVLLGMVAPLLLVLGAPVTLALQAASRPAQRKILRVLHSGPIRVLTHPLTAWLMFGSSVVTLYFTPLYELSLRNDWFHVATHAYFLLAGTLFLAHVVGLDPIPHALGYGARLLYVLVLLRYRVEPDHVCQEQRSRQEEVGVGCHVEPVVPERELVQRREIQGHDAAPEHQPRGERVREYPDRPAVQDTQDLSLRRAGRSLERERDRRPQDEQQRRDHSEQHVLDDMQTEQHPVVRREPGLRRDQDQRQPGEKRDRARRRPRSSPRVEPAQPDDVGGRDADHDRERDVERPVGE